MSVKLIRTVASNAGTFGYLVTNDRMFVSLELPWRDNKQSVSCVPAGTYEMEFVQTSHFGTCYHLKNVPGRGGVLVHWGNWAGDKEQGFRSDSLGCILIGTKRGSLAGQPAILQSRIAKAAFDAELNYEPSTIEIVELYERSV